MGRAWRLLGALLCGACFVGGGHGSARATRQASRAEGQGQELIFLEEEEPSESCSPRALKDYLRLFRSELEENARRALFRRKKQLFSIDFSNDLSISRRFLPFEDCVKWVQAMGLWDSKKEWEEWIAMGEKRNPYIPTRPDEYYGFLEQLLLSKA